MFHTLFPYLKNLYFVSVIFSVMNGFTFITSLHVLKVVGI
jgi:hypothetical protein